ncbi:MAG: dimethyl sulfoxide reductase anchor subunit [Acidobacteria bacterium]|nr:dimethyl sulfoxide reductase anchor subunit [Acidobacteriota bacterium]
MSTQTVAIVSHRFGYGFYRQAWWNWLIGSAFFFGEIGAGFFLVSQLTGNFTGMVLGYLIVMVGKNTAHLKFLGRPMRFWRAALRPDRSWIARGIWATGLFGVSGLALLLKNSGQISLSDSTLALANTVASLSALFIMFYDGFVMNFSHAVPFWHSSLLPVLCLTYAALGGTTLTITLRELQGVHDAYGVVLLRTEFVLLVLNLLLLLIYVKRMSSSQVAAARETVRLLVKGPYAKVFIGLVILVGLVATLLLSLAQNQIQQNWLAVVIATCELTGDYAFLMVLLKSGLFSPQTAPAYARG